MSRSSPNLEGLIDDDVLPDATQEFLWQAPRNAAEGLCVGWVPDSVPAGRRADSSDSTSCTKPKSHLRVPDSSARIAESEEDLEGVIGTEGHINPPMHNPQHPALSIEK